MTFFTFFTNLHSKNIHYFKFLSALQLLNQILKMYNFLVFNFFICGSAGRIDNLNYSASIFMWLIF